MVTLDDVAAAAGVSRTTASRAMNGIDTVDPARRDAVLAAAERLGYRANPAARSLARGRHDSFALLVPETDIAQMDNSFFSLVLHGIIRRIARTDFQLIMLLWGEEESEEKFLRYLESSHIDGAMVILEAHNTFLPRLLSRSRVPVVYVGRPVDDSDTCWVDADNVGGARLAAEALVATGRRRLGVITGPRTMGVTQDRLTGWVDVLGENDIAHQHIQEADFRSEGGALAMRRLLETEPDLDGVFVMSDLMAAGALITLRASGRSVPGDVSLVSFDDTSFAMGTDPALTTIHQPLVELGAAAVEMLLGLTEGSTTAPARRILPTVLTRRASL